MTVKYNVTNARLFNFGTFSCFFRDFKGCEPVFLIYNISWNSPWSIYSTWYVQFRRFRKEKCQNVHDTTTAALRKQHCFDHVKRLWSQGRHRPMLSLFCWVQGMLGTYKREAGRMTICKRYDRDVIVEGPCVADRGAACPQGNIRLP